MRTLFLCVALALPSSQLSAQAIDRFIEVVATDTVQLALQGIDFEVAMPNPFDIATIAMSAGAQEESDFDRLLRDAERKAQESERQFLDLMKANGFVHRLSSTEHAEDYAFDSGKEAEVNTYLVELKDTAMIARFQKVTTGTDYNGTVKNMRFSDAGTANARLMAKLHEQAKTKAGALAAASGGQLGKLISATEMRESEGSIFEQLMKMERGRRSEGSDREEGSSKSCSMVFRFALLMN